MTYSVSIYFKKAEKPLFIGVLRDRFWYLRLHWNTIKTTQQTCKLLIYRIFCFLIFKEYYHPFGQTYLRTTQHYAKIIDRKVSEDMLALQSFPSKESIRLQTNLNRPSPKLSHSFNFWIWCSFLLLSIVFARAQIGPRRIMAWRLFGCSRGLGEGGLKSRTDHARTNYRS